MVRSETGVPSRIATGMKRNPYLNRSMIREVGAFYGRQRETERVLSRVGAFPPQSRDLDIRSLIGGAPIAWPITP